MLLVVYIWPLPTDKIARNTVLSPAGARFRAPGLCQLCPTVARRPALLYRFKDNNLPGSAGMVERTLTRRGLVVTAGGAALAWAAARPAHAQSTLERIKEQGYVRVGFANEAPFGYATTDGKLTGEAPEIARVIFERLGVPELDGVLTEFGSLIPGLRAGRFDVIAAGMYVTPKRCEQVDFSEPTYSIGQAFLVPAGNPEGIKSFEDFAQNEDLTLGVMAGAIEGTYAQDAGVPRDRLQTYPDGPSGVAAVRAGRIAGFALSSLSINNLVRTAGEGSGVEATEPLSEIAGTYVRGHGAFGFRPEDDPLREAFNAELAKFIGTPEHLALVKPFGFDETTLPEKTTEELCAA
jgi:polar amino acid transport system substrate-binding protein